MKVSLRWLSDYVKPLPLLAQLTERLTIAGLEVTGASRVGGEWQGILVGQVEAVLPHPNADRLKLARVNIGPESHTVVCGAPNIAPGQKVAFARVGARLRDGHTGEPFTLRQARIRGVPSAGMACSEKELGLGEDHTGILVLPPDAPVGTPLAEYLGDTILDIDITPNRPDWLSLMGIAWEVAALFGSRASPPPLDYPEAEPAIEREAAVEILDPDLCPRYSAALIKGVRTGPSPRWLQERLASYGMRPINNVVDVTNYVMIEMGQPLHAFDFRTLRRGKIVVRRARPGETLASLDGVQRTLSPEMLVIADAERPVAIAGVMGGLETEVTPDTTDILLEAANFAYTSIRRTAAALKLRTEASLRFERGLNPEIVAPGIRRAVRLILELAGGRAARGIIDAYPGRRESPPVLLPFSEVPRLLGISPEKGEVVRVLSALGFQPREVSPQALEVVVPYWRSDVRLAADLVEEVARILGYDRIPTTILSGRLPRRQPSPLLRLKERVRQGMAACGLQEVITYSLTSAEKLQLTGSALGLRVSNPLSREQEYLRTSLRPGLLGTLALNQRLEPAGVRLFEVGRVYLPREGDLPQERERLGAVLWGGSGEVAWGGGRGEANFYEARGVVEALFRSLGGEAGFSPGADPALHPARQAEVTREGERVGVLGELHPSVAEAFDLLTPVFLIELELTALLTALSRPRSYQPLPRFPAVIRDLALVVDEAVPAGKVVEILRSSTLVARVRLFDLYRRPPIPQGQKSLAFRLYYQSPQRTLTEAEVAQEEARLVERLSQELGARLRS